jgi:predicted transcriptional regulator
MPRKPSAPPASPTVHLSRRERQIMDVVYAQGQATAAEIHAALPDPPVPAAVRTMLRILEDKGQLRHDKDGTRHVYHPVMARTVAQRSAVRHMVGTFFNGSRAAAIAALLDDGDRPLTATERSELSCVIERLRAEGQ